MKKFFGLLLAGMLLVGPANAQDEVSVGISLDALSGYVWRGGVIGADNKAVLQPGIELGFGESGLTVGAWGSIFAQDRSVLDGADEVDIYADYSTSLGEGGLGISIGFTEYLFPNAGAGAKHSEEAYVGISLDHQLAPSVTFYYDFGLADAWYLVLSLGVDVPLGEEGGPALSLGASAAISDYGSKTGFNDVTASASVSFGSGGISIAPTVAVTFADKKVNPDTSFWFGVSIGFSPGGE